MAFPSDQNVQKSDREKLFEEVDEAGTFGLRSCVGGWWAKALKNDVKLADSYKQLGKQYEAQRQYRARWAKEQYQKCRDERIATTTTSERDDTDGRYKALGKIVIDEGGDETAVKAALTTVQTCIELHRQGQTFKGRPYVFLHPISKRYQYLHLDFGFNSSFKQDWSQLVVETPTGSSGSTAAAGAPVGAAAAEAATAVETPMKRQRLAAGVKAHPQKKECRS